MSMVQASSFEPKLRVVPSSPVILGQATSFEPKLRVVPSSAVVLGQLHQWGGRGDDDISADVFSFHSELWKTITTQGAQPPGLHSAASAGSEHYLYTYGGRAEDNSLSGCLHRLDTKTCTWSQLAPHSADSPMKKCMSWMIVYKNWVIVIGGIGTPRGPLQPGSEWIKLNDDSGQGLTNEMHKFDIIKGRNTTLFELLLLVK